MRIAALFAGRQQQSVGAKIIKPDPLADRIKHLTKAGRDNQLFGQQVMPLDIRSYLGNPLY